MALSLVVLILAAAPATSIRLASPGLSSVNVAPELQNFVTDHVNQQLVLAGVDVLSSSQVAAVIGLERQKQLLGCNAATDCVAEFANALGVDGLLLGSVAKFGATLQLDLRVAAASDAKNLATVSIRIPDESGLLDAISQAATSISTQLSAAMKVSLTPSSAPSAVALATKTQYGNVKLGGMVTFFVGTAALIAGLACLFAGSPPETNPPTPPKSGLVGAGIVLSLVGLPAMLTGSLLWIFGGTEQVPVKVSFFPSNDGFRFALTGRF